MMSKTNQELAKEYQSIIKRKYGVDLRTKDAENELARFLDLFELGLSDIESNLDPP